MTRVGIIGSGHIGGNLARFLGRSGHDVMVSFYRTPASLDALEVPEATQPPKDVRLQVALAFSLPVFVTPPNLKRDLRCTGQRSAPDTVTVSCDNEGKVYAQPRELDLSLPTGQRLATREAAFYMFGTIEQAVEKGRKLAAEAA